MENKLSDDPEAVAIAIIMKSLASFEEARKSAILNFVIQRVGIEIIAPKSEVSGGDSGPGVIDQEIKTFLKSKDPKSKYQQVAVLAYYLIKKKGQDGINKDMIEAANKEALGRTIDDISGTLNDAKTKYGFFGTGSGGKKILLAYGEDIVEALPDQEKVKSLTKKGNTKKRRVKKVTKKAVKK